MFEKVNPSHPDKVADRIAGALVDLAYSREENPKVAVEVLIGHGYAYVIAESSVEFRHEDVEPIVNGIVGKPLTVRLLSIPQDAHLAQNQADGFRCGDNGIFKGTPVTREQQVLTSLAHTIYEAFPTDGKYVIAPALVEYENLDIGVYGMTTVPNANTLTICQSHAEKKDIQDLLEQFFTKHGGYSVTRYDDGEQMNFMRQKTIFPNFSDIGYRTFINPLGPWTGGPDVDTGATNRKLGSDMGDSVTGGGLMGKDLSKADVSVNIACWLRAQQSGQTVTASCAIGDADVTFVYHDGKTDTQSFSEIVEQARLYILTIGGFEKFAMWGLIRHCDK